MTRYTLLLSTAALAACSRGDKPPPQVALTPPVEIASVAVPEPLPTAPPVQIVEVPTPLPLPGQLKPLPADKPAAEARDPRARIEAANHDARIEPTRSGYLNAVQVYPFTEGALYQLYAAPGQVTDIALQPGEQLVGNGPVAAGDTTRWVIGDTSSGSGETARVHILVKPVKAGLATNLVINTDRRTYHLELRSAEKDLHGERVLVLPDRRVDRAPPRCGRGRSGAAGGGRHAGRARNLELRLPDLR